MALQPLESLPETPLTPKRALVSVSDKRGLESLARALHAAGVEIISTGGTAARIRELDIPVTGVSELTGFPECLDGRVKTLHPKVHAGVLARTSHAPDREELARLDIEPIELVAVNLYPFGETVARDGVGPAEATEHIDIGGPTLIRAAAKNFAHVAVLTSPDHYASLIEELQADGTVSFRLRRKLALEAFNHTAAYDARIAGWFSGYCGEEVPSRLHLSLPHSQELRYGENPHQKAAVYGKQNRHIDCFHGKQLSYNNLLDVDAALNLMADFGEAGPTCAIFKHTVPCGVASAGTLREAWSRAFATDTQSPYGGIVAVNRPIDRETAEAIDEIFTEIVLAPSFEDEALELLTEKKNRRLIRITEPVDHTGVRQVRSIFGGALAQEPDHGPIRYENYEVVTKRRPTEEEVENLLFAWKVVKHVKSNAIVYARGGQTLGIGSGQTSRVESSKIAIAKAREEGLSLEGSAIASDAFFPFADGVEAAAEAGAESVIQPGGSIRDEKVIEAADRHGMAMVFTGMRHFRH
ncbi:MAG: bifunctional phosphoribosylaminoimidazolecarboxamide formyltransferase/IMP cyclohydrolase [Balneolaceae bacterium]|nr:bifunctional phosphoribosylaminoimidazolecarboxamide formyltransferase/IMP cyclohydrolase [Balneolaceae bacterium]